MKRADRSNLVVGVFGLLVCVLLNVWVFRYGFLVGLVGLNLTKHVGVAVLCQAVGVNKGEQPIPARRRTIFHPGRRSMPGPHSPAGDAR